MSNGGDYIRIGFIGAGKAGFSLGKFFTENGMTVTGYASRSIQSAVEAALFTHTKAYEKIENLVEDSDVLFLTVPDGQIEIVWEQLRALPIAGKRICHCSGLLSSSVFSGIEQCDAYAYSIHPLFAISDKMTSYMALSKALFTIEGSKNDIEQMEQFLKKSVRETQIIDAASKVKYHTAAVMVSNQVTALVQISVDLLESCGFAQENAIAALAPLMLGNIHNILRQGPKEALTGPAERNDVKTIRAHLACLSGTEREIYIALSKELLKLARDKHPERDFSALETELMEK